MQNKTQNVRADATIEVWGIELHDGAKYWQTRRPAGVLEKLKLVDPNLQRLALAYLSTPASSVPCERVFIAGEILSTKEKSISWKNYIPEQKLIKVFSQVTKEHLLLHKTQHIYFTVLTPYFIISTNPCN